MAEKKKNYFDEQEFQRLIKMFQETAIVKDVTMADGKIKPLIMKRDEVVEKQLIEMISKIVKAVIQVNKFYIFEDRDDCYQHAMMNCCQKFIDFTPEKGRAYSYFNKISSRCLLNYTTRKQRHRGHADVDEFVNITAPPDIGEFDFFLENLSSTLYGILDYNFTGKKRLKFAKLTSILLEYLDITRKFNTKTDMYAYFRSFGFKSMEVREYIKEMSIHNEEIFSTTE